MKVVICGAGQVGFHLARYLSSEGNEITVVDQSPELIGKINDQLDVQAFVGHASYPDVLERAGARTADMLIAVTRIDEVNMVACQIGHSLFKVPTKIARVRQQGYLNPVWSDLFQKNELPIEVVISPEVEVAGAIARRIKVPGTFDMIPMLDDKMRVLGVRCMETCPIVNTPLRQLTSLFPDLQITIVAIIRQEKLIIPHSDDQMLAGDEVYFVVHTDHVSRAMAAFGHNEKETRRIVIVGGGHIGATLAKTITDDEDGYSARIIEMDKLRARKVAEALPTTTVIQGDALDYDILEEAGIHQIEAVVAVTDHDETNILCSLLCKHHGVSRAVTLVNRGNYAPLVSTLGVDVVVNPREITASKILQHIRRGKITSVHSLRDGFAEVIEAEALDSSVLVGKPLSEARLPDGVIIGGIMRGDQAILPRPKTIVENGDKVVILAASHAVPKVEKIFSAGLEYF